MGELESDSAPHVLRNVNRGGTVDGRKAIEPQVRTLLFWNFFLLCKEKSALSPRKGKWVSCGEGSLCGFAGGASPSPTEGEWSLYADGAVVRKWGALTPSHPLRGSSPHGEPNGRFAPEGGEMEFVRGGFCRTRG